MASLADTLGVISARLGELESDPVPLEGGMTNRNFMVSFAGEDVVVRLPGKDTGLLGIDRAAERAAGELAAEAGVGPGVVGMLDDPPCLITQFVAGEPMGAGELRDSAALAEVAVALRSLHACEERLPIHFSSFRVVEDYAARMAGRGAEVPASYEWALAAAHRIEAVLTGPEHEPVPCHNDLLAANFIRSAQGIRIIDWEYAGMNDRYFDLGNFAVNNELDEDGDFIGADALAAAKERGPRALLRCLTLEDPRSIALGNEPVRVGGEVVGRVTTGGYGHTVERSIAYAYLPSAAAEPDTAVEVEIFGRWVTGEVAAEPLFDPEGERVRA